MTKIVRKFALPLVLLFIFVSLISPVVAFSDGLTETKPLDVSAPNDLKYFMDNTSVSTGKDNGYSKSTEIKIGDPHFGWKLGRFLVSGYTIKKNDDKGNPVFLKGVGDNVILWFHLDQDINKLVGKDSLTINEDKNGYDEQFGIKKSNFGQGTLITRFTNYQNSTSDPIIYNNYLAAKAITGADTKIEIFEEGDYEVALDYEIKNSPREVFGQSILSEYTNYRIYFRFSIRNGNCMVFPKDLKTGSELANSSFAENGFSLDLAKSRYLNINVEKGVLKRTTNGLIELDVRFNGPARDGDEYKEEGIYKISVSNPSTGEQTTKTIYVGTDDNAKAFVTTESKTVNQPINSTSGSTPTNPSKGIEDQIKDRSIFPFIIGGIITVLITSVLLALRNRQPKI